MATSNVKEVLPPTLDSTSEPPAVFDGTTRLYLNYQCPVAQRAWITRNYKGLQDKIKLVPVDWANRPIWYKEKVCPENKQPCLEDDNKIIVDSIDMLKYIDAHFEGPALLPEEAAKREFAEELLAYANTFIDTAYASFKGDTAKQADAAFGYLESALEKFEGPFLLGQLISLVDIFYIPFVERVDVFLKEAFKYDITSGRPKVAAWLQELNKIDAYLDTKVDPDFLVPFYKKRYLGDK
ncbi:hypothetical protein L6452_24504 [Arctium lappa]|uniref:Uncharacterized protein n=1 Tax=Arctium lappa TaxID=4217 RepID=A0ACB9AAI7_ARCLA|nr:hypothetical protein L6452_24504 [Arctium lappa]